MAAERHALLRDVDIRHLAALQAVADEGAFGRAAERLGYTQSAVSQQIATLEKIVGGILFERPGGPRPIEITPLGELVLDHARAILTRVETAETEIDLFRAGKAGTLSIGTFQSVSVQLLPPVFQRMREERPGIHLRIEEMETQDHLVESLTERTLDVAFLVEPIPAALDSHRLLTDPFVVLSRPGSQLGGDGGPVPVQALSGVPIIGQFDPSHLLLVDEALRRTGIDLNVVFRSADNTAVQAMVRAGMGHAVMPWLAVDPYDPGVVIRKLDPGIPPRVVVVAWLEERHPSPQLGYFVGLTREVAAEQVADSEGLSD